MKASLFLSFFLLVTFANLNGQILIDDISSELSLLDNTQVQRIHTDSITSLEDIKNYGPWKEYDTSYTATSQKSIWLKFELENQSEDTVSIYLYNNDLAIHLYKPTDNGFETFKNGKKIPLNERANKNEFYFTEIKLAPLERSLYYLFLDRSYKRFHPEEPKLFSETAYFKYVSEFSKTSIKSHGFIYFYLISLSTILVFAIVFWVRLRKKLYLYYLGYLLFQLAFGLAVLQGTSASFGNLFEYSPKISWALFEPLQFIFIGFYIFFILHLLTINRYDKLLAKTLKIFGAFCFVYAVARFGVDFNFENWEFRGYLFRAVRIIVIPLNLFLIFWIIYKVKHPLIVYFIVGQSAFFIGASLSSYIIFSGLHVVPGGFFNFPHSANIIFQIGLLIEVFCFSLALSENISLLQKDKEKAREQLISQLQKNRHLQEGMNLELDKMVNEKTEELIQLYTKMEKNKEAQIKSSFNQKLRELEMAALRSQMNPHFLFNSLNAIKHLIMTSRNEDAELYLDKFSNLLRSILVNSSREVISVEEELEILELYLTLESHRMDSDFKYYIEYSSREALWEYKIPPLLLQPFVENAIWHGLQPSLKQQKRLTIRFDTTENLKIEIEDNGVGRKASNLKQKLHKSMGMDITKERITLFNHLHTESIHLQTIDLEENNIAKGTKIILTYTN
ncbi:MAG: histidine kinase [Aequorivita sp.]